MITPPQERVTLGPAERLHGRLDEVRQLWEAFHRAQRGEGSLVLLDGPAGIGKTRLVESLIEPMRIEGGRVSRGSWVRQRTGPLEGLLAALDGVVSSLLAEPDQAHASLRAHLEREVGGGLALLTGLLPELELLTGPRPPPPAMAPQEAQQRFELLVHRLVCCFAAESSPLVLFLDDLQWAEPSSLRLLGRLVGGDSGPGVLVICALRTPCEPPCLDLAAVRGALGLAVDQALRISLAPLAQEDVQAMVADLLSTEPARVAPLARLTYDQGQGNPWATQRFLVKLQAFGALTHRAGAWCWDLAASADLAEARSEPQVVASAVSSLPAATRGLLELGSCLGPELDGELLALASGHPLLDVMDLLEPALQAGMVVRCDRQGVVGRPELGRCWRFAHERLHQSIYQALEADTRRSNHRRIVRRLRRAWNQDQSVRVLFTVADQLHQLSPQGEKPAARQARIELLMEAGHQAVACAAWSTGERHLEAALEVLPSSEASQERSLELHRLLAQAMQATGRFDRAEGLLDRALALAGGQEEVVALRVQRVTMLVHAARYVQGLGEALSGLAELGSELPERDDVEGWTRLVGREAARQPALMGGRQVPELAEASPMPPGRHALELSLLGAMAPVSYVYPAIMPWVITRMVNLCLEHGNGSLAPLAFVFQGLLCSVSGQHEQGQAFGKLALELERQRPDRSQYAPVIHLYVNFINHWTRSLDSGLELGLRAVNVALQHGQFDYAGWLAMNGCLGLFYRGLPLPGALQRSVEQLRLVRDTICYDDAATVTGAVVQVMGRLSGQGELLEELGLDGVEVEDLAASLEHYRVARVHVYLLYMIHAVLTEDFATARRHADALRPELATAAGMVALAEFALFETVLLCHEYPQLAAEQRAGAIERAEAHLAALETWAQLGPATYEPRRALAAAELAAVRGQDQAAAAIFVQAVEAAASQGFLQLEALACARAARFHTAAGHGRTAALFLEGARDASRRWGAAAAGGGPASPPASSGTATELPGALPQAQVQAAGKAARTLSEGLDPSRLALRLAEAVVDFSGARRLAFFDREAGELVHLASAGPATLPSAARQPIDGFHGWPIELVRRVHRSGETSGSGAVGAGAHARTPDAAQPSRSWLCLPLSEGESGCGVLHLEHEGREGAFEGLDLAALRAMGDLALTALRDLGRYADLARLSQALEVSSSKLATHSATLQAEVLEWAGDLEALHEEHRSTLEALLDGVVRVDLQGTILYANPAAARITGFSAEELVGAPGTRLLEPQDLQGATLQPARARQQADSPAAAPFHAMLRRKDGSKVSVEFRWSPVFRPDGSLEGGVIAIRDTSQRQQLERQLRQSQKMEAMGRFAGGMAHDLNNLLTPIRGHLERIQAQAGADRELLRRSEAAAAAAERATALVKQVLAFSRRAEVFKRPHDLVPIVDDVCQFLSRSMDRAIQVRWSPPKGSFWFLGDAGLVQQVLLNLGLNARHALEVAQLHGGLTEPRITIELSCAGKGQPGPPLPRGLPDPSLVLTVGDNGIGMDEATQARIFEPFFTTKPADQGTGLGLSVVYGIVDQHGGRVTVQSQPGHGAAFTCYLPSCAPERRDHTVDPVRELSRGGGQTVLVVDDEAPVRELAREVLEEFGYRVLEAVNGESALDLHLAHAREIHLVLLDLSMPGISGPETLRRLLARDPRLPVVLWSGYSAEDDLPASVGAHARAFLEKPFELAALVATVQEVLGGGSE